MTAAVVSQADRIVKLRCDYDDQGRKKKESSVSPHLDADAFNELQTNEVFTGIYYPVNYVTGIPRCVPRIPDYAFRAINVLLRATACRTARVSDSRMQLTFYEVATARQPRNITTLRVYHALSPIYHGE